MICRSFRKYAGAFADGELDTRTNAEALEHLNMCPRCTERVVEIQRMKQTMARVFLAELPPTALTERIQTMVRGPAPAPTARKPESRWANRILVPLSVAAAVLAAFTVWQTFRPETPPGGADTTNPAQFAEDMRVVHADRVMYGQQHPICAPDEDLAAVATSLGDRLGLPVYVPDLGRFGYKFLGAEVCSIQSRNVGHLFYRQQEGERTLSLFCLPASACGSSPVGTPEQYESRTYMVDSGTDLPEVAWSDAATVFVFCGPADTLQLLQIAAVVRVEAGKALGTDGLPRRE